MERQEEKIIERNIEAEMKTAYIDYAMSVIVSRALPDARDGLKPVHRRILYSMHEDGITSDKPYRKCANTVGSVLGRYHPHGDASVYDAMVRLAQDFSMRYMLIDGHGNFGSIDGDGAAAMRYTESRMAKIAEQMLVDIEKNTVNFMPNYDSRGTAGPPPRPVPPPPPGRRSPPWRAPSRTGWVLWRPPPSPGARPGAPRAPGTPSGSEAWPAPRRRRPGPAPRRKSARRRPARRRIPRRQTAASP